MNTEKLSEVKDHFDLNGIHNGLCLFGDVVKSKCVNAPVKCHSIQEHRVLNKMCNNQLEVVTFDFQDHFPQSRTAYIKHTTIAEASTFSGLCAKHDCEVFKALDSAPFDPTNLEMISLLTYRTMLFSYTKFWEAIAKCQLEFQNRADTNPNYLDPLGTISVLAFHNAMDFFGSLMKVGEIIHKSDFTKIYFKQKIIPHCMNLFASSFTHFADFSKSNYVFYKKYVSHNFFVEGDTGYYIISGLKEYQKEIDQEFNAIIDDHDPKWVTINKVIRNSLEYSNNFYFSTKLVKTSDMQKNLIFFDSNNKSYFVFSVVNSTNDL